MVREVRNNWPRSSLPKLQTRDRNGNSTMVLVRLPEYGEYAPYPGHDVIVDVVTNPRLIKRRIESVRFGKDKFENFFPEVPKVDLGGWLVANDGDV